MGAIESSVQVLSGTKDNPTLTFKDDPNSGFFLEADGTIAITINGTVAARITSSGLALTGALSFGASSSEQAPLKGIYHSAVIAVAVPSIADGEADEVAVDVAAAFTVQPAVGDAVIAIPVEALPTACVFMGAYVSATDEITVSFDTLEGGAGVTGDNIDFRFLLFDLT